MPPKARFYAHFSPPRSPLVATIADPSSSGACLHHFLTAGGSRRRFPPSCEYCQAEEKNCGRKDCMSCADSAHKFWDIYTDETGECLPTGVTLEKHEVTCPHGVEGCHGTRFLHSPGGRGEGSQ